jgi:metal-responsive CopG/Arc/MetJ family transcriptional regulator
MDHIVSVGLDTDTLKQLDDLRRAHPNVPSRSEVIKRLIWVAHAKIAATASDIAS